MKDQGIISLLILLAISTSVAAMDYSITQVELSDPLNFGETITYNKIVIPSEEIIVYFKDHDNCEWSGGNVGLGVRECKFPFFVERTPNATNPNRQQKFVFRTDLPYTQGIKTKGDGNNKWDGLDYSTGSVELEHNFVIGAGDTGKFSVYIYQNNPTPNKLIAILDPTYGCTGGTGNHTGSPCDNDFCSNACPCSPYDNFQSTTFHYACGVAPGETGNCGWGYSGNGDCDSDAQCMDLATCQVNVGTNFGCTWSVDMCLLSNATYQSSSSSSSSSSMVSSTMATSEASSSSSSSSLISSTSSSSSSFATSTSSSSSQSSSAESSSSSSSSSIASVPSTSSSISSSSSSSSSAASTTSSSAESSSSSSSSIASITSSSESSSSSSSTSSSSTSSSSIYTSSSSSSSSSSIVSMGSTSSSAESSSSSSISSSLNSAESSSSSSSSSISSIGTTTTLYYGQTYAYDCSEVALSYKFNLTAGTQSYKVNLSQLPGYLLNNMMNVNISRGGGTYTITTLYLKGNESLMFNATSCVAFCDNDDNEITVSVYGFEKNYVYSTAGVGWNPTVSISLATSNMSNIGNVYNITLKKEIENTAFSPSLSNKMTMTVKCNDYSSYILDLKAIGRNPIIISTRQWATAYIMIDEVNQTTNQTRSRILPAGDYNINYYLIAPPYTNYLYTFILQDLTGQYPPLSSFFYAKKYISANLETAYSQQFDTNGEVESVPLVPGADYQIIVCNPGGACYDFGKITAAENRTITLTAVKPVLYTYAGMYDGLTAYLTKANTANPVVKTLGFVYNSSNAYGGSFYVLNLSANNTVVCNSSSTASYNTFTCSVDNNATYQMYGEVNDSQYGIVSEVKTVSWMNNTVGLLSGMPSSMLGIDSTAVLLIISFAISILAMLITTKTNNQIGTVIGLFMCGIFIWIGWASIPARVIGFLLSATIILIAIRGQD